MNLNLALGTIVTVSPNTNEVGIRPFDSGGTIPAKLDSSISLQEMPQKGAMVLYIMYSMQLVKIVKIWNMDKSKLRGELMADGNTRLPGLALGDVQYQSPIGGGYVNLGASGDVSLVEGTGRGFFKLLKTAFKAWLQASEILVRSTSGVFTLHRQDGGYEITKTLPNKDTAILLRINISNDGSVSLTQNTPAQQPLALVNIDAAGNISINSVKGGSVNINNGTDFAARVGDDIQLNIPALPVVGTNTTPMSLTGKIITGSKGVKIG